MNTFCLLQYIACKLTDKILIYLIQVQALGFNWQFVLDQPIGMIVTINLKGIVSRNSFLVSNPSLILAAVFQKEQDMIRNFTVYFPQDSLIHCLCIQANFKDLNLGYCLSRCEIHR